VYQEGTAVELRVSATHTVLFKTTALPVQAKQAVLDGEANSD
jgi:hypothetical protein